MIRYVHGSADSTDLDVMYVFPQMPDAVECQRFCNEDLRENRNIIVVENGVVQSCFKGYPDEVNNALLSTYTLHAQEYPLLIQRPVPRDIFQKDLMATRKVMSYLTASDLRSRMKAALRGDWHQRIAAMGELRFAEIDFDRVRGPRTEDILKSMAFQTGQGLGLHRGVELYTKADIASYFPELYPCLYRQSADLQGLQQIWDAYQQTLSQLDVRTLPDGCVQLTNGAVYDIHREKRLV